MEVLFLLIGIGLIVGAILGFVAVFRLASLRRQLDSALARIADLEASKAADIFARRTLLPWSRQPQTKAVPEATAFETVNEEVKAQEPEAASTDETPAEALPPEPETLAAPKPQTLSLEDAIGGKWAVWVGGVALTFGAVFLAKYSIEQGLLSPETRLLLGFGFSLALIAAGEWTRRRGATFSVAGFERANVPATLTGAGTTGAFAVMYIAYAIFSFIGPTLAFAGMGLLATGTMFAAVLHGPSLAALGLLGAYAAPFMVSSEDPSPWTLALYALAVSAAAYTVARIRLWLWLAIAAAVGLCLFTLPIASIGEGLIDRVTLDFYLACAFAMSTYVFVLSHENRRETTDWLASAILTIFILASWLPATYGNTGLLTGVEIVTVLITGFGLAAFCGALRYLPAVAAVVTVLRYADYELPTAFRGWMFEGFGSQSPGALVNILQVDNVGGFLALGILVAAISLGLATWRTHRSAARVPLMASASILSVMLLAIAWGRIESFGHSFTFFIAALALTGLFVLIFRHSAPHDTPPESREQWPATIAIAAAFATIAVGMSMVLEHGFLTIALALIAPAIAYVNARRPMPGLLWLIVALMTLWALRVLANPAIVDGPLGTIPIFNWLLYGWGLSAAAFALACFWTTRRTKMDPPVEIMEGVAIATATIGIALLLTHAWDPAELFTMPNTLGEGALLVLTSGGVALGLLHARRNTSQTVSSAADLLGYSGMIGALWLLLIFFNPLWTGENVGTGLILNTLALGYLTPAALYAAIAWRASSRPDIYRLLAWATAGILAFVWVSLTIRHYFQRGDLSLGWMSDAELYTYSIVWLIIGIAMLVAGVLTGRSTLRHVSGGLIILVILKVFLIDMASLAGILRALSFIGLGACLVGVGLFYQRLLGSSRKANDNAD
jgi:uncharacterized membrane protein